MKCLLDIDGVLADFQGAACRAHGRSSPWVGRAANGVWDMAELWGIAEDEFWAPLCGREFWAALQPTVECFDIVKLVERAFGPRTWVNGYTNDVMSYIPSERVWKEGGYEAGGFSAFGLPAKTWPPDIQDRIRSAVERLVKTVSGGHQGCSEFDFGDLPAILSNVRSSFRPTGRTRFCSLAPRGTC